MWLCKNTSQIVDIPLTTATEGSKYSNRKTKLEDGKARNAGFLSSEDALFI